MMLFDPTLMIGRVLNVAVSAAFGLFVIGTTWAGIIIMFLSPTGNAL